MSIASGLRTFFKLRRERHDSGADDLPASSMPLLTELGIYSKRRPTMNMALPNRACRGEHARGLNTYLFATSPDIRLRAPTMESSMLPP